MACTDTGLKIWTLLAVDTLKPLLRKTTFNTRIWNLYEQRKHWVCSFLPISIQVNQSVAPQGEDQTNCARTAAGHTIKQKLTAQSTALTGEYINGVQVTVWVRRTDPSWWNPCQGPHSPQCPAFHWWTPPPYSVYTEGRHSPTSLPEKTEWWRF